MAHEGYVYELTMEQYKTQREKMLEYHRDMQSRHDLISKEELRRQVGADVDAMVNAALDSAMNKTRWKLPNL